MRRKQKRLLAIIMSFVILFSNMNLVAFAADDVTPENDATELELDHELNEKADSELDQESDLKPDEQNSDEENDLEADHTLDQETEQKKDDQPDLKGDKKLDQESDNETDLKLEHENDEKLEQPEEQEPEQKLVQTAEEDSEQEEQDMINISSDWNGSVMGDIGTNDINFENFEITENDDNSVTLRASNNRGKISSAEEGLAYYYKDVDPDANYEMTATARVDSWDANNQVAFGIMLRSNVLVNERDNDFTGDYLAVGGVRQEMRSFYKYDNESFQYPDELAFQANVPAGSEEYELSITKSGNVYQLRIGNETKILEDYSGELNFAGLFAARNTTVTYSNVNLNIDGDEVDEPGEWEFRAFGGNTSISSDPVRNPDPVFHDEGSITLKALGGKIASSDEGISFYHSDVAAGANFTISAQASVENFNTTSSIGSTNQKSFGLMLRNEVDDHGDSAEVTSNYTAVGALDTTDMKGFYNHEGVTLQKLAPFDNNIPAAGEVYDLSIQKAGDTYVFTSNGETETVILEDMFHDNIHLGLYVARDAEVTFSNFSIDVDARTVSDLQAETSNMETSYLVGEELDLNGLVVTAEFSDGKSETLSEEDYIITGFDSSTAGTNTITLNYRGVTTTIDLEIIALSVTGLEIQYFPAKTTYYIGDAFRSEGLVIIAEYNDGYSYERLSSDDYNLFISDQSIDEAYLFSEPGIKTVTVTPVDSSNGVNTSFEVTIVDTEIANLDIRTLPLKTQYFIGDELDLSGIVIYAVYDDGSEIRLRADEYQTSSLDTSTPSNQDITFSHKGVETVLTVNVKERELSTLQVTSYPKTTYYIDEEFEKAGLEVSIVFDNGDIEMYPEDNYVVNSAQFDSSQTGLYDITIQPGTSDIEPITYSVTVREMQEHEFDFIMFGQSTSHQRNDWSYTDDGAARLEAFEGSNAGKITGDHDGIVYYYTVIDAEEDNFELSADIRVEQYAKTPHDGQESFGIMARDAIGTHGDSGVFSSNIAAVGGFAGGTQEVNGTQLFVRTGVISPDGDGSQGIQKKMLKQERPSAENTHPNEPYRLTLSKTNSGFTGQLNNEGEEIIFEPEILKVQDSKMYVGFYVAREATIEVSNIDFQVTAAATDAPREEPPAEAVSPDFNILSLDKTPLTDYDLKLRANVNGVISIRQGMNFIAENKEVTQGEIFSIPTTLQTNRDTNFSLTFLPDDTQYLTSYDQIIRNFTVTNNIFVEDGDIYVSPDGSSAGSGLEDDPLDIDTAIDFVLPGQTIIVEDGHYLRDSAIKIRNFNDGTAEAMKYIEAAPGARPVFDFDRRSDGMLHEGNYWHVKGLDFTRAAGNRKGYHIGGHHNIVENSRFYNNGDSGLQISRIDTTLDNFEDWPSHNLILNSVSFDNRDPAENNADGFAVKLTVGEGNILRGAIAHNNVDDGFDLYAKLGTGAIGTVIIEDSLAFHNGTLTDGTVGGGDKNGFKLGGEGIHVPHTIRNSAAFENGSAGFSSNSNPGVIAEDNISFDNEQGNLDFTTYSNITTDFTLDGFISFYTDEDGVAERYPEELQSDINFLYDSSSSVSVNKSGMELPEHIIEALRLTKEFKRDENGVINWGDVWDTYYTFMDEVTKPDDEAPPGNGDDEKPGDKEDPPPAKHDTVVVVPDADSNGRGTVKTEEIENLAEDGTLLLDASELYMNEFHFSKDQISLLISLNASIRIETAGVSLTIPAFYFSGDEDISIAIEEQDPDNVSIPDGQELRSSIFKFTVKDGSTVINEFTDDAPAKLEYKVELKNDSDETKLSMFYYNASTGEWEEKTSGEYKEDIFYYSAEHFSIFAVMEDVTAEEIPPEEEDDRSSDNDGDDTSSPPGDGPSSSTGGSASTPGGTASGTEEKEVDAGSDESVLPSTATNTFNLLIVGLVLLLAGMAIYGVKVRREKAFKG